MLQLESERWSIAVRSRGPKDAGNELLYVTYEFGWLHGKDDLVSPLFIVLAIHEGRVVAIVIGES